MSTIAIAAPPVRPITREDFPQAVHTLSAAFYDDPVVRWMLATDDRLERGFRLFVERVWSPHGGCVMTDDGLGVANWMPPGSMHSGVVDQLRLLPRMARLLGRSLPRVMSGLDLMEKVHPEEPHWYLPTIGVAPDGQGRGIGSRLLRYRLDRCDQDGLPAYLEATTLRSRALYERHGFETVSEQQMPKQGPLFWPMWREPR